VVVLVCLVDSAKVIREHDVFKIGCGLMYSGIIESG
jgi:hypothetical protein